MIKTIINPKVDEWTKLQERPLVNQGSLFEVAEDIFNDVRTTGDIAVSKYSRQFDGVNYSFSPLGLNFIRDAESEVPTSLKESIEKAYHNIYKLHASQTENTKKIETTQGVSLCSSLRSSSSRDSS